MIRVTKRAKSVEVFDLIQQVETHTPKYTCPTCRSTTIGWCCGRDVTRFICECGQELIIKKRISMHVDRFYNEIKEE